MAATALPKFKNVARNATVANFVKIVTDVQSGTVSAFVNEKHLNDNNETKLSDVMSVAGKGWSTIDTTELGESIYDFNDSVNNLGARFTLNNGNGVDANLTIFIDLGNASTGTIGSDIASKLDFNDTEIGTATKTITYDLN